MRIFGKLFSGILGIMILMYAVFGTIMIQTFFNSALDKEIETCLEEMNMFQYSYMASLEGLEKSYSIEDRNMIQLMESVEQNIASSGNRVYLYNKYGRGIYPERRELFQVWDANFSEEHRCAWRIQKEHGLHKFQALISISFGGQSYYLGMERIIDQPYESREQLIGMYGVALILVGLVSFVLSGFIAAKYTRPILRLSTMTKEFTNGNMSQRVDVRGDDEIAFLMEDFNVMADQIEENMAQLRDSARKQEEFTGAFAHELKTPLTSIIGYAQMLRTMELDEEELRQSADYIYREGRRLESLAYKMMDLIGIRSQNIVWSAISMDSFADTVFQRLEKKAKDKSVSLEVNFKEGKVSGDMDLLESLFCNIAENGIKACKAGEYVSVKGFDSVDGYKVEIMDNGCGINESDLPRITEAFYMADKSRSRKEGGAGLGMTICKSIVKAHHASWTIRSKMWEGTTITITFPPVENQEKEGGNELV